MEHPEITQEVQELQAVETTQDQAVAEGLFKEDNIKPSSGSMVSGYHLRQPFSKLLKLGVSSIFRFKCMKFLLSSLFMFEFCLCKYYCCSL